MFDLLGLVLGLIAIASVAFVAGAAWASGSRPR
jgi:hypothetical protein